MNAPVDIAAVPVRPFNMTATVVGLVVCLAFVVGLTISIRLLMGDRYCKTTPREQRWDSGLFLFLPIWAWLGVHLGHSFLDRAGPVSIWLCGMCWIIVVWLFLWVWAKFVPAFVSWWLAGFVWVITLWLAVTCRFA
jgi:hypothetical protein